MATASRDTLFGHPKGLAVLAVTEVWERFSYYGMRALLVFYMVKHLNIAQDQASKVYGIYTAAIWLSLLPGGLIVDRYLGQRRAVIIGAGIMAAGHFMMAFEPLFYPALGVIVLGNGLFKPSISTQVGDLYPPGDDRKDQAYSLFYVGINLGSLIAPLVCGTVGELYGWHWGFGLAGAGMVAALAVYILAGKHLPPDRREIKAPGAGTFQATTREDWRKLLTLSTVAVAATLFWTCLEQSGNTMALWADSYTDRRLGTGPDAFVIPATWAQSLNGLFILAGTPLVLAVWHRQRGLGREPRTLDKMTIGAVLAGLACLLMALAAVRQEALGVPVSWLWVVGFFALITLGELYLSPTCLSLVNKMAPAQLASTMVGVWYLSLFLGSLSAGYIGALWSVMSKPAFFALLASLALTTAAALFVVGRTLAASLEPVRKPLPGAAA